MDNGAGKECVIVIVFECGDFEGCSEEMTQVVSKSKSLFIHALDI